MKKLGIVIFSLLLLVFLLACKKETETAGDNTTTKAIQDIIERNKLSRNLPPAPQAPKELEKVTPEDIDLKKLIACSNNAFVTIQSSNENPQGKNCTFTQGSGFIINKNGYVITNAHVVNRTIGIKAVFNNGTLVDAELIKIDPYKDLALLKLSFPFEYSYLPLADSNDKIEIGDKVAAFGTPLGLQYTPSIGYVTGMRKQNNVSIIQTDAPVNPGNSGGPLLNNQCKVVGVISFNRVGGVGLNFAISSTEIINFLNPTN